MAAQACMLAQGRVCNRVPGGRLLDCAAAISCTLGPGDTFGEVGRRAWAGLALLGVDMHMTASGGAGPHFAAP
eukprot:5925543-Amphidinium_carterae.2